jgi:aldose 1-epimerase
VITSEPWGLADGRPVELYTLSAGRGMSVRIATFGGTVQSLVVPDRGGALRNVALGFGSLEQYVANLASPGESGPAYFGALVGRYANRIADRSFVLDGERFELAGNSGPDDSVTAHGGPGGYSAQVWEAAPFSAGSGAASLRLTLVDPAGRNGFPGTVHTDIVYSVTEDHALRIEYHATTDAPTVVNLTHHTYFNLAGEGSGDIYKQKLAINSNTFTPTDANLIPTGFHSVAGTPFDFRAMKPIGRDINKASAPEGDQLTTAHGYDHNWVLRGSGNRLVAVAQDPGDGIVLSTFTTEPGLQVYTGNFLVGDLVGTSGHSYRQSDAFTLETQHYPDTPHHIGDPQWPSVVLNPGQVFNSSTTYKFSTAGPGFRHNF